MPQTVNPEDLSGLASKTPAEIIAWFEAKEYVISWDWREVWQEEHLRAFTVAKAMSEEVLDTLKAGMLAVLERGWSQRKFLTEITPLLKAKGWWGKVIQENPAGVLEEVQLGSPWRLKTIYRTNFSTAFSRGRYKVLKAGARLRPYWMYDAMNDSRTRPHHRVLDNRVYRHDDPIWHRIFPPSGFNCRCLIRGLTAEEVEQKGLTVSEGQRALPPDFPDEGWDYNPATETPTQLALRLEKTRFNRTLPTL